MGQRFPLRDLQRCAEREVALRRNVYRRRGMTDHHQREIAMMQEIAELLAELADAEPAPSPLNRER